VHQVLVVFNHHIGAKMPNQAQERGVRVIVALQLVVVALEQRREFVNFQLVVVVIRVHHDVVRPKIVEPRDQRQVLARDLQK
jgi:hypothetical protein